MRIRPEPARKRGAPRTSAHGCAMVRTKQLALLCATKRRPGACERGNIARQAVRIFVAECKAGNRAIGTVNAYLPPAAFSASLPVWAAPIGGTASFIDGSASFGAAAVAMAAGWAESAFR